MAINGLNKITDKILDEARESAARIMAEAEAESERIRSEYAARADEAREKLFDEAEREATDLISRTKAAAANQKRNLLLETQSRLIDEVFSDALNGLYKLGEERYIDILLGLLTAALAEQLEAEKISRTLYGEEEAMAPETYEIVLNTRDRDRYGKRLLEDARKKLTGKLPADALRKLTLSATAASIDGGLILRCGSIESNCSLALLFAQLREELEAEICHALFDNPERRL